jgi:hypothetical protein
MLFWNFSFGISDFNSIPAQDHTPADLSRQPQMALAAVAWPNTSVVLSGGLSYLAEVAQPPHSWKRDDVGEI